MERVFLMEVIFMGTGMLGLRRITISHLLSLILKVGASSISVVEMESSERLWVMMLNKKKILELEKSNQGECGILKKMLTKVLRTFESKTC